MSIAPAAPAVARAKVSSASGASSPDTAPVERRIGVDERNPGPYFAIASAATLGAAVLYKLPVRGGTRTGLQLALLPAAALFAGVGALELRDKRPVGSVIAENVPTSEVLATARRSDARDVNIINEGKPGRYTLFTSREGAITATFVRDDVPVMTSGNTGGWPFGSPPRYDFGAYDDQTVENMIRYNARLMNEHERAARGTYTDYRSSALD